MWEEGEEKHVSRTVATFRSFASEENGQEKKKHTRICLEKCFISREGEEEPDAAPLVFHTSADLWFTHRINKPPLSLCAQPLGNIKAVQYNQREHKDPEVSVLRKPPESNLLINYIVRNLEGKCFELELEIKSLCATNQSWKFG